MKFGQFIFSYISLPPSILSRALSAAVVLHSSVVHMQYTHNNTKVNCRVGNFFFSLFSFHKQPTASTTFALLLLLRHIFIILALFYFYFLGLDTLMTSIYFTFPLLINLNTSKILFLLFTFCC